MSKCVYKYKGKEFSSKQELNDFLISSGDYLYKKYGDLALNSIENCQTLEKLETVKKISEEYQDKYKEAKKRLLYLDGEDILNFEYPYIGVTEFLRGLENLQGELLTPTFEEENYWLKRIADWKDPNKGFNDDELEIFGDRTLPTGIVTSNELKTYLKEFDVNPKTDNEVLLLIRQVKERWIAQGKSGTAIHDVLRRLFSKIRSGEHAGELVVDQDENFLVNTYFNKGKLNPLYDTKLLTPENIRDIVRYAKALKQDLVNKFGENISFFPEFLVTTKLSRNIPEKGDTVLGIIDLLVIDEKGNAHVIDYKASPKNKFNSAKERTFSYQLGMYARMLQSHGIPLNSLEFNIMVAPIKMENFRYDEESKNYVMDRIIQRDPRILLDITGNSMYGRIALNLDDFIPEPEIKDVAPQDIIKNHIEFMSKCFPDVNTTKVWDDESIKKLINRGGGMFKNAKTNKWEFNPDKGRSFSAESESQLFDKIKKYYLETLPKNKKSLVYNTITALRKGIRERSSEVELPKVGIIDAKSGADSNWFKNLMAKYCNASWVLAEHLVLQEFGIVLLRNIHSQQIDVLLITTEDVHLEHKFHDSNKRTLITGAFEVDAKQMKKPGSLVLPATTGNIRLMEAMALLNCIPEITSGSASIGEIRVINPHNLQGYSASNEELLYCFKELASHIDGYKVNVGNMKFAKKVDLCRNRLKHIMSLGDLDDWKDLKYKTFHNFSSLMTDLDEAISLHDEKKILKELEKLRQDLEKYSVRIESTPYNEEHNLVRSLYDKVMLAIAECKGISFRLQSKDNKNYLESVAFHRNGVLSLMLDNPGNLNNDTLNLLTKLITEAYLNVREDVLRELSLLRPILEKFKSAHNFSLLSNLTIGNNSALYKELIEYKNGDILFKNPWDPTAEISSNEARELLKHILKVINTNRFGDKPEVDIEELRITGDPKFFRVPLVKGDTSSRVAAYGGMLKAFKKQLEKINPKKWAEEVQRQAAGVFTDVEQSDDDTTLFQMRNFFEMGEHDTESRIEKIAEEGPEYFEINLETLLLKHTFAYSMKKHVDSVMPMAKASMIHLISLGHLINRQFTEALGYIQKYLKNKVKNESIVDPKLTEVNAVLGLLKGATSLLLLGFSPVLFGYQTLQGLWTDIRLWFQNYGIDTPFTAENFMFALKQVYSDLFHLGGTITKCSLLNEFFGINDMDMNTYIEKVKSDRFGLYNISNIAFYCSSRPDFFNRMTLFVAQMKKDGVWEAYSKNSKNELEYNWENDARFSVFARGLKDDPKYIEQSGLYYAMAELLVKEHAMNKDGSYFKIGDPLPKAYTNLQMESFKSVYDNIYGYYSHEKKSLIHATTLGTLWMLMRTFWSGKKNQYLGGPGIKLQGKYVLLKNENGELMWLIEEDGRMVPTTQKTGIPLLKWEGLWLEGIIITLANIISDSREYGFKTTIDDLWNNPDFEMLKANIKQLMFDFTMFMIVSPIITGLMADWDDELTDEAKKSGDLATAAVAAAAHMGLKMVSSSFSDFNFISSIGGPITTWEPVTFSYWLRRMADISDVFLGDKDFTDALFKCATVTSQSKIFWDTLIKQ